MAKKNGYRVGEIPQGNGNYLTGNVPSKGKPGLKKSFGGNLAKVSFGGKLGKIPGFGGPIPGGRNYAKAASGFTGSQKSLKNVLLKKY